MALQHYKSTRQEADPVGEDEFSVQIWCRQMLKIFKEIAREMKDSEAGSKDKKMSEAMILELNPMVRTIVAAVKESNLSAVMPTDLSVTDSKVGLNKSFDAMTMTDQGLGSKIGFHSPKSQDSMLELK